MTQTVVVTGAAGFIGSHLVRWHLDRGDKVIGIDDFSSSRVDSPHMLEFQDSKYTFERAKTPTFWFLRYDITNDLTFHIQSITENVDIIYNFACPASPPLYQAAPIHTLMTSTLGVKNMLMIAKHFNARFVHASTSEVYGDPAFTPQNESYWGNVNSYGPRSCYDEGKRAAEALCYDFHNMHNVDARLCRIFNTYGPHMDPDDGRVITNFVKQALRNEPLTVYGEGHQTRSFCYVDDLVDGIVRLGALNGNPETPVNIGNPNEISVIDVAKKVIDLVPGCKSEITFHELPVNDPLQRKPDISLAFKLLSWYPQVSLKLGLKMMIEYMSQKDVIR